MNAQNETTMEGISLQEFLQILRRRRLVVLQSFVIISLVTVVWTLLTHPVYRATARLLVESPSTSLNTVDTSNPLSAILALTPPQSVDTQVQALQSPELMAAVQRTAGGADMSIKQVGSTNIIEVTSESTNPKAAAAAPNALLHLYIDGDLDQNLNEIKSAEKFAQQQETAARKKLDTLEDQLEVFKRTNHVAELESDRSNQVAQVTGLNNALVTAQTNLSALQAQIVETRRQLAQQPDTIASRVLTTNTAITALKDNLAALQQQRLGLTQSGGYTDKAPQVIALDAQIKQVQKRLADQGALASSETISPNGRRQQLQEKLADMEAQAAALRSNIASTTQDLSVASAKVGHYAGWEVTLAHLNRQLDEVTSFDKMLTDKLADLSLREQAHHATAQINESAQVPTTPVRPKKAYNIMLGALFGVFIGICLALLQEFLDDRINTVEDANRILGLSSLGYVPALTATDARLLPGMKGMDPAAESYRLLRTNIQFASIDTPMRTLLVTSSSPGEGKTTTAANLAFAMVMDGKKVILVDTDLRRPSLHKLLGLPTVPGLTDVLLGRAKLDDTLLENTEMPNLVTLTAGSTPPNPSELLNSRRFRNLVDDLMAQTDLVIFDSPPVTVASDAPILASQMDGTIMVVETGETRKAAAKHSVVMLQKARANVLGIMYNKMSALDGPGYYYYQYQYTTPALEAKTNGKKPLAIAAEDHEE